MLWAVDVADGVSVADVTDGVLEGVTDVVDGVHAGIDRPDEAADYSGLKDQASTTTKTCQNAQPSTSHRVPPSTSHRVLGVLTRHISSVRTLARVETDHSDSKRVENGINYG
jgi:hypothetical protein